MARHEYSDEKCECGHLRMDHTREETCDECACSGFESAEFDDDEENHR